MIFNEYNIVLNVFGIILDNEDTVASDSSNDSIIVAAMNMYVKKKVRVSVHS